jgi:surfeit locus 1 family protein
VNLNDGGLPDALTPLKNRDAVAQGEFDFAYQGIVKLQNYQSKPGVHLIAPLVLDGGETAVLVNRGWVPEADNYGDYNEPGSLTINGYVGLTQTLNRDSGVSAVTEELAWYRVDIEAIQAQMPYDLLPIYINQAPEANDAPPFRAEREVDLSEGPHMGYAIQWFLFAAVLAVMYTALVYKDVRSP